MISLHFRDLHFVYIYTDSGISGCHGAPRPPKTPPRLPPGQETSQNASIIKVFYMSISADFYKISCISNDVVLSISSLYSNAHGAVQSSESPRAPENTKPAPRGLQNCPECKHYKGFLRVHFQQIPLNFRDFHDFFAFWGPRACKLPRMQAL